MLLLCLICINFTILFSHHRIQCIYGFFINLAAGVMSLLNHRLLVYRGVNGLGLLLLLLKDAKGLLFKILCSLNVDFLYSFIFIINYILYWTYKRNMEIKILLMQFFASIVSI
jgi:hypothetical protein